MVRKVTRRATLEAAIRAPAWMVGLSPVPGAFPEDLERTEWLALWDAFWTCDERQGHACEALDEAAAKAANEAWLAAERAIIDKPARSLFGIAIKLAFWVSTSAEMAYAHPEKASPEDLVLLSAWRAVVRLAGLPEEFGMERYKKEMAERASHRDAPNLDG